MKIKNKKRIPKKIIITIVILVVLIGGALYWWFVLRNPGPIVPEKTTEQTHSEKIHSKSNDNNKNNTKNATETAPSSPIGNSKEPATNNTPPSSNTTPPETPSGTFVSNHFVNLTSYTSQNSVCHTSPGAKCTITFSQGSTIRSLPAKQTDANGNTSWDWDVKELGLTTGTWTITAKATNGKYASTAVDQINLEVK